MKKSDLWIAGKVLASLGLVEESFALRKLAGGWSGFLEFMGGAYGGEKSSIPYEVTVGEDGVLKLINREPGSELSVKLVNLRGGVSETLFEKSLPTGESTFDISKRSGWATYGMFRLTIHLKTQNGNFLFREFEVSPPALGFLIKVGR